MLQECPLADKTDYDRICMWMRCMRRLDVTRCKFCHTSIISTRGGGVVLTRKMGTPAGTAPQNPYPHWGTIWTETPYWGKKSKESLWSVAQLKENHIISNV